MSKTKSAVWEELETMPDTSDTAPGEDEPTEMPPIDFDQLPF